MVGKELCDLSFASSLRALCGLRGFIFLRNIARHFCLPSLPLYNAQKLAISAHRDIEQDHSAKAGGTHLQQTPTTFSTLYQAWREGAQEAGEELAQLVYQQLHLLAKNYLSREPHTASLQTTELIHETWLRLFGHDAPDFVSRGHFFVIAARQMRRILIDRAREAGAARRIPKTALLPISKALGIAVQPNEQLLALEEALQQLEHRLPRAGQVVELRYFAGLTEEQTALVLAISVTTVKRDWDFARLWLYDCLSDAAPQ